MQNVMLDLETMGITANSAIVSIGAVKFDLDLGIINKFYEVVDLQSCIERGFDIDGKTVQWWLKQSEDARKEIADAKKAIPIKEALTKFKDWLGYDNLQIWGNGSDFDNTILINAFQKFKVMAPWRYTANRCYRTLRYSFPTIEGVEKVGTSHKSVDDAEYQANYLIALVEKYKLKNVL
jgi:exodeoxyribonuclease VIII